MIAINQSLYNYFINCETYFIIYEMYFIICQMHFITCQTLFKVSPLEKCIK